MPDAQSLIAGVGQIGIVSKDPARLIAFYRDVLGFPVRFEAGAMTFLQAGATSLMIAGGEADVGGDVIVYFEPSDWSAAEAKLEAAGVVFERDAMVVQKDGAREHALRPFRDPDGRPVYLMGWRPGA